MTLRWEALNAYSLVVDGLGSVATRGSRTLTPAATTTYTLTVTGAGGTKTASTTVTVEGTTPAAAPSAPGRQSIPRLANGRPDLSGVYLGGRDVRLAEQVVVRPGAESFRVPVREDDLGLGAQCLPSGVPGVTLAPYPLQIVHKEDLVVILYEAYNIFRIIPIDREHGEDLDSTWLGNSVARWEGDTLVVDVVGFNDKTLVAGHKHTEALHVVERYRRVSYDAIEYEATAEDPNVFAAPVRYAGNLVLHPEWEIGEYICAENNKTYSELLE
jgi:PKD repeat protein